MAQAYMIRTAQLDLARQMETPAFIRQFIDFIAENGFNALLLYLEGRIRTPAFPYPSEDESYSAEVMRQIVAYASDKGVEVIPCISCLGHAEQYLQYPQMQHLAEVRPGWKGRFGGTHQHALCPSLEETKQFLEAYLLDIAEIFPSTYFHVGLDEVFDLACCPKCATQDYQQEQKLYLQHIQFCHQLVTGKLGRQMMMWDDMFEFYPDILAQVPRDVIMVNWQYQTDVQQGQGHFLNLLRRDALAQYDKLGLRYLIAPWDASVSNVLTFTRYASDHQPMGGIMTMWEKQRQFIWRTLPAIALAGRLWNDPARVKDDASLFAKVVQDLAGSSDELLIKTWRAAADADLPVELSIPIESEHEIRSFWSLPSSGLDYANAAAVSLIHAGLKATASAVQTPTGKNILADMKLVFAFHEVRFELDTLASQRWGAGRDIQQDDRLDAALAKLAELRELRHQHWQDWRGGIGPDHVTQMYDQMIASLQTLKQEAITPGALRVRFCLPDKFSAPQCRISLKYDAGWQVITQGVYKGRVPGEGVYDCWFAIDPQREPAAARVEIWGSGGQGVCHLQVRTQAGVQMPAEITARHGRVVDPNYLLDDDAKPVWMGDRSSQVTYRDRKAWQQIHLLECSLEPA